MQERDMILLVEMVEDLLKLNDAIKNLGGLGYQMQFPYLDNIYTVIKNNSIYSNCNNEEQAILFYRIVNEISESPKRRIEQLRNQ